MKSPAKDEKQARFFAIDAEREAAAAFNANKSFFNSQSQKSKVATVVSELKQLLRVNGFSYYEKIFETARSQKKKGVFTDVTVNRFIPNKHIKSSTIIQQMQQLGFAAEYNPRSNNIKVVVC